MYDKISHRFIASYNNTSLIELEDSSFGFVKFFADISYTPSLFVRVFLLNNKFFIQLTEKKGKYFLYKTINTKFKQTDFKTNGLIATGKNYDEYVDNFEYFLKDNKQEQLTK